MLKLSRRRWWILSIEGLLGIAHSILSARTHALDVRRMPPLATQQVDHAATAVLDDWIRSVTVCPAR